MAAILIFAVFCVAPFLLVMINSFADEISLLMRGYKFIPEKFSMEAYRLVFNSPVILRAYGVTIFITVVGTGLSMLFTSMLAYAISPVTVKYRNVIAFFVYFTMLFSGGLVAFYILIVKYLQLKNSIWVLILPSLINPWWMFLMRNFFRSIPESLSESARIDGANDMTILARVILPLSKPALATFSLFYALAYWNEWFRALLFIESDSYQTLQLVIMKILRKVDSIKMIPPGMTYTVRTMMPQYTVRLALTIVTIGPIILLYPFLQKYFVKGIMIGAIKG